MERRKEERRGESDQPGIPVHCAARKPESNKPEIEREEEEEK